MNRIREWEIAAVTAASAAGVGFSTGREIVLFFAQMGGVSWMGAALASAMFAALCGEVCHLAQRTGADSLAAIFAHLPLGGRRLWIGIHAALMIAISGVMLAFTGRLAALTVPVYHAYWMGMLLSAGLAAVLNGRRTKGFRRLGVVSAAVFLIFFAGLALDRRPVTIHQKYVTVCELWDNVPAAMVLSVLYAALTGAAASAASAKFAAEIRSPRRYAVKTGALMLAILTALNGAILSGGVRMLSQPAPLAVLSARWGKAGFRFHLASSWLCAEMTLIAAMGAVADGFRQWKDVLSPRRNAC